MTLKKSNKIKSRLKMLVLQNKSGYFGLRSGELVLVLKFFKLKHKLFFTSVVSFYLFFPGSRTLTPVPHFGPQATAAHRVESQGALRLRVESPVAERLCGCEDLPHSGILVRFSLFTTVATPEVPHLTKILRLCRPA